MLFQEQHLKQKTLVIQLQRASGNLNQFHKTYHSFGLKISKMPYLQ